MRWKFAIFALIGVVLGIAASVVFTYLFFSELRDANSRNVPLLWSSAGKDWPVFSNWLAHGGRKLVLQDAFSAAKDGMSEPEFRAVFGPPDLVVVGTRELEAYPIVNMKGLGATGAYFYKVGSFASVTGKISSETFAVVFNSSGQVVYRLAFGGKNGDQLDDITVDTRSDRLIAPIATSGVTMPR